jgi:hypothetical protein
MPTKGDALHKRRQAELAELAMISNSNSGPTAGLPSRYEEAEDLRDEWHDDWDAERWYARTGVHWLASNRGLADIKIDETSQSSTRETCSDIA